MKRYTLSSLSNTERQALLKRPSIDFESVKTSVRSILSEVKTNGDKALTTFTERFDGIKIDNFLIDPSLIEQSVSQVDPSLIEAMEMAASNIQQFHKAQLTKEPVVETMAGVQCWREKRAIERVGLYIPGGTAILPSTVLMLALPAQLAGCKQVVLCTPPNEEGSVAPEILAAANISGVTDVFCVGGAQAVAAMAYGTNTIPQVDKIFGPGNQYVTTAKMLVAAEGSGITIDMPAGPSEVLVIADEAANPAFVAADLLSQTEHGIDSQVVLITTSAELAEQIEKELETQLAILPRKDIASESLKKSLLLIAESLEQAMNFSNDYAPEHLILNVSKPRELSEQVMSAGSVFLGSYTPESVGDYASGTNHTLPTYGYARNTSGVSIESFIKNITFQELSTEGLKQVGPTVERIAEAEQLQAHKNAVSIRLQSL